MQLSRRLSDAGMLEKELNRSTEQARTRRKVGHRQPFPARIAPTPVPMRPDASPDPAVETLEEFSPFALRMGLMTRSARLSKSNAPPIVFGNIQPEAFSGLMASSTIRRGSMIGTTPGSSSTRCAGQSDPSYPAPRGCQYDAEKLHQDGTRSRDQRHETTGSKNSSCSSCAAGLGELIGKLLKSMEPTSGLEPLTCRLRIDPVLRMLLCDKVYSRAFWGVFEHSGDHLYSTWYSRMTSRFQIGRVGHCQPGTAAIRNRSSRESRYFRTNWQQRQRTPKLP